MPGSELRWPLPVALLREREIRYSFTERICRRGPVRLLTVNILESVHTLLHDEVLSQRGFRVSQMARPLVISGVGFLSPGRLYISDAMYSTKSVLLKLLQHTTTPW
jgi:hypothetical protein